ncbi:MAG: hypothetical protein DRR19_15340 [Candidatus Parabeggiatoa sp. nov. 1]|nr:MAG: hypothetical protein DRR19_15340 [Gammaproteobacteria bacterium]
MILKNNALGILYTELGKSFSGKTDSEFTICAFVMSFEAHFQKNGHLININFSVLSTTTQAGR